jgi:hypothetical protein
MMDLTPSLAIALCIYTYLNSTCMLSISIVPRNASAITLPQILKMEDDDESIEEIEATCVDVRPYKDYVEKHLKGSVSFEFASLGPGK